MTNIILQHFDGNLRPLDELSMANIKEYAEMVGAEYKLITGRPFRRHLTSPCQKVHMLDEEFDGYDQVLMLDIDMFAPKGMTENVFDLEGIGLYSEVQNMLHRKIATTYPLFARYSAPYWGGAIYKMNLEMRKRLRRNLGGNEGWMNSYNKAYVFEDEGIMHTLANFEGLTNQSLTFPFSIHVSSFKEIYSTIICFFQHSFSFIFINFFSPPIQCNCPSTKTNL